MSPPPISLSEPHLDKLLVLIERDTGLVLSTPKRRELRERFADIVTSKYNEETYFQALETDPSAMQNLVNKLTIGESYFFRNHPHFNALKHEILPDIIKRNESTRTLKIWSAGCSSGEEPYSLSILLQRDFPFLDDWDVKIMATDINTEFINKAKLGQYTPWSFRGLDQDIIQRYFIKYDEGKYQINQDVQQRVTFSHVNLSTLPVKTESFMRHCDLIVCRNVLIYFQTELATRICETFSDCLNKNGYLLLGHSESFPALRKLTTVYSHATYYYRKQKKKPLQAQSRPPRSRLSIVPPGLGPYNPEKLIAPWEQQQPPVPTVVNGTPLAAVSRPSFASLDHELRDAIEQDLMHVRDYSLEGNLSEASALLDKLEATDGKLDFRVYFLKALIADQHNEPEEALSHLKQSIFLNKDFTIGHYYQGIIAERFGNLALAKRGYRNAYRLAQQLRPDAEVSEGGGIRSKILCEIAEERLKELELQEQQ